MTGHSGYEREASDWYVEPEWCVDLLADAIDFEDSAIWDPACGQGTVLEVFRRRGHATIASDLVDRGAPGWMQGDFLGDCGGVLLPLAPTSIVTNPPYALSAAFIARALPLIDCAAAFLWLAWVRGRAGPTQMRWLLPKVNTCGA